MPVVGVASASQGPHGEKPTATYNLFSIDGKPGSWKCRLQRQQLADQVNGPTVCIGDYDLTRPETVPPGHIPPELGQDHQEGLLDSVGEAIGKGRHDGEPAENAPGKKPD